jgi:predicted extracellular nuclease
MMNFSRWKGALRVAGAAVLAAALAGLGSAARAQGSTTVVISQIYGGGGNSGATLTNDFIELLNVGSAPILIDGWTVQYASATGTNSTITNITPLTGTIPAKDHPG